MQDAENTTDPRPALAARMRELRQERGLSELRVATEIGIAQSTYHEMEAGTNQGYPVVRLIDLARYYGLPLSQAFPDAQLLLDAEVERLRAEAVRLERSQ